MTTSPKTTTVRTLGPAQVFSLPESGLEPAVITGISQPVGGVRFIECDDLATGEPLDRTMVLSVDRQVLVYDVEVAHHWYTYRGETPVEVRLGRRIETVEPDETLHYTGEAKPQVFPAESWEHVTEPVVVSGEDRPL